MYTVNLSFDQRRPLQWISSSTSTPPPSILASSKLVAGCCGHTFNRLAETKKKEKVYKQVQKDTEG